MSPLMEPMASHFNNMHGDWKIMCLFKSPKVTPPPPPPRLESRQEEELRERKRLLKRQGQFLSPFAVTPQSRTNPFGQKTLLGG